MRQESNPKLGSFNLTGGAAPLGLRRRVAATVRLAWCWTCPPHLQIKKEIDVDWGSAAIVGLRFRLTDEAPTLFRRALYVNAESSV